jgi:5-(aminomethyl)-3-furanmethanol phosphate kinase
MSLDAVLKVGGSLGRGEGLEALCQEIGRLGARRRLLIVPGGGEFADLVRDHYRRYGLGETTAHRMALMAMDQYGYLLGDLIPGSALSADMLSARQVAEDGRVPILLPASLLIQADPLPHSWEVTSDAIAGWVAGLACARRLILLKDVDGLFSSDPAQAEPAMLISRMSVSDLAGRQGGVDEYLASVLETVSLETWVVNGRRAERLAELLSTGRTLGTLISPEPRCPSSANHPRRR